MIAIPIILLSLFAIYKLFIDGYLFKIPLFFGGWFGIFILSRVYISGARETFCTLSGTEFSLSFVIATSLCFLVLLTTKG